MSRENGTFGGYYSVLKEKRRGQTRARRKKKQPSSSKKSSFFLTQGDDDAVVACWTLAENKEKGVSQKESVQESRVERRHKHEEKIRKEYYERLPIKPGVASLLGIRDCAKNVSLSRPKRRRDTTRLGRPAPKLRVPHTIIATNSSVEWIYTDKEGNLVRRNLDCVEAEEGDAWPEEFLEICRAQRERNAATRSRDRVPSYVAVRRLPCMTSRDPESNRTFVASSAAVLGHLQKIVQDRRERKKNPRTPTAIPLPSVQIWQPLIWGRGTQASVYRIQWRRRLAAVGTCLTGTTSDRAKADDDEEDRRVNCCSLEESFPYIVCHQDRDARKCAVMGRVLHEPAAIVAEIVRRFEGIHGGKLRFARVTCDFVRSRQQEWYFLQIKSFRLTAQSYRSMTTHALQPTSALKLSSSVGAAAASARRTTRKRRSSVRIGRRSCSLCKQGLCSRRRGGSDASSFSLTADMMTSLVRDLRFFERSARSCDEEGKKTRDSGEQGATDEEDDHDVLRWLLSACNRLRRQDRYRSHSICASCHELHENVKRLRSACARRAALLGVTNASVSSTRRRFVAGMESSAVCAMPASFGRCSVMVFCHDISEMPSRRNERKNNGVLFRDVATILCSSSNGGQSGLRIAILPSGQSNTCVDLVGRLLTGSERIALNQCCAFDFLCERNTASSMLSDVKHALKLQIALSLADCGGSREKRENDPIMLFGEASVVTKTDTHVDAATNQYQGNTEAHMARGIEVPLSTSPMERACIMLRVSIAVTWSQLPRFREMDGFRTEKLCNDPLLFRQCPDTSTRSERRRRILRGERQRRRSAPSIAMRTSMSLPRSRVRSLEGFAVDAILPPGWLERLSLVVDSKTLERLKKLGWNNVVHAHAPAEDLQSKRSEPFVENEKAKLNDEQIHVLMACIATYGTKDLAKLDSHEMMQALVGRRIVDDDKKAVASLRSYLRRAPGSLERALRVALFPVESRAVWLDRVAEVMYGRACDGRDALSLGDFESYLKSSGAVTSVRKTMATSKGAVPESKRRAHGEETKIHTYAPSSFVTKLLKSGRMLAGASSVRLQEYLPEGFLERMISATIPSLCAVMRGANIARYCDRERVLPIEALKRAVRDAVGAGGRSQIPASVEGFCLVHGNTRLYASDYYCKKCIASATNRN